MLKIIKNIWVDSEQKEAENRNWKLKKGEVHFERRATVQDNSKYNNFIWTCLSWYSNRGKKQNERRKKLFSFLIFLRKHNFLQNNFNFGEKEHTTIIMPLNLVQSSEFEEFLRNCLNLFDELWVC